MYLRYQASYTFKLKLDKVTGDILNSHCECPAGRGPHSTCKHVAAVALMLSKFVQEIRCTWTSHVLKTSRSFINHVTVTMVSMVVSNWAYKYHTSNIQYNNASSFLITIYTFIRFILKVNVKFIKPSTNRKCMKWADFLSPSNIYNNLISEYLYFTLKAYQ